jgi:catechol 2,3-dioxygenase-like lactoylglutathione lyase family enzyme
MTIQLDHMILAVNDRKKSVEFYVGILGLKYEGDREPFSILRVTPDLTLQLSGWGTKGGEHLAFSMSRKEFDEVFRRVVNAKIEYGDEFDKVGNMRGPGDETAESINSAGGGAHGPGMNLYFFDPSRHLIEIRHYER